MKLKRGYKQTEVGVLPEEWDVCRLSSLLEQPRSVRYGIVQPGKYEPSGCLMLRSQDYSKGWSQPDEMHRVSSELESQYRNARIRSGDLIMTVVGAGIGQVAIAPDWLDGAILSRSTARIAVDDGRASRDFVKASLESPVGKRQILDCQKEGAQPVVSCQDLAKFLLPCPPSTEQRAIARAMSDVDGLLDGLDRLIAKKRALKQAAMQQLLTGQTRLPGFRGEWEVKRLGLVGRFLKGSGVTKDQTRSGTLACIRYGELYTLHNDVVRSFQSWISPEVAATAVRLKQGDILFAGSGETKEEIGKCAAFVSNIEAYAGGDIVILRPYDSDSRYLGYYLNTGCIARQKASRAQGDAVVHISSSALSDVQCKLPSPAEQTAIAEVVSEMDAELAGLEQRREKSRALKQAMVQELLSGRTRLVSREEAHA